ncbi:MAG: amylo-alpha-1,6-glucosidase [Bacteroidia bacterium]|nr:MAG: amylo-alpha-1,6-glucosidase [Bacteroidia bacterium]
MGYIKFDKTQLINLEYSLDKEMVRSNRSGAFSCTTIVGCNTRKYHGLLISKQPQLDGEHHVLLSKVDESVIQRDAIFNLGVNKYPGKFHPKGHKYIRDFTADIIPVVTYRVGGVVLTKETMFVTEQEMVMIRYTLREAHSPTRLRLQPFLAFRNIHSLSKRNIYNDTKYTAITNGIKVRMYEGYPYLHLQLSKKGGEYVHAPDWYNDLEYVQEAARGYEAHEDLFVPGFFEVPIKKGESIILSASTAEVQPGSLTRLFNSELKKRIPRDSFRNSLLNTATQFFALKDNKASITAGFPWMGFSGRYTFISLPGLSLVESEKGICKKVIDNMVNRMNGPFFPESIIQNREIYHSADTSLWFFHALQHCMGNINQETLWKHYGGVMEKILNGYAEGYDPAIHMNDEGLLWIDSSKPALTWMNAESNGRCHSARYGYVVEVNALWYNAIKFAVELASAANQEDFVDKWSPVEQKLKQSFPEVFWNEQLGYLTDFVTENGQDTRVRPNQVISVGLRYTPMPKNKIKKILDVAVQQLLTPRGLRSLSPRDPGYKGRYFGDTFSRDTAYHQGTVWVWPLGFFTNAWFKVYGRQGADFIKKLYTGFEETITENGIGTVSEIFEGDPPHKACGALSFAASLGELLRIDRMLSGGKK